MKGLEFLQLGEYTHKEMFLQHISELVQVKIEPKETYNDMFLKLQEKFEDYPERLEAVNVYIKANREHQEDQNVFNTILNNEDRSLYAVFNMHNL